MASSSSSKKRKEKSSANFESAKFKSSVAKANKAYPSKEIIFSPEAIHKGTLCGKSQWVRHDDGRHHFLRRADLKVMARGWYEFVIRSIMPTGNRSEVTMDRAVLIHSIISGENIQFDEIIAEQFYQFINKTGIRTKLPFPGIIQRLCAEKKGSIPDDTMIPVEPHINSKLMERVKGERAARRQAPPPEQQNQEAAEIPQVP
ncbi:hypothetical protein PIB30_055671 [Stylosanthes scabra]|uniref:Putative plant transposon protein domain-containing protein n=1 Tax=Stylosanthes scabra TaxID=79078 RepID=A0ABU6ZHV9_9FABA|nr:hypothetical protein [Stylosanthes scabra]